MVEFLHLTKSYKKRVAVRDFTLSVDVPIFGFLGQNGAGKSTIMKMTVGLLEPTSGSISMNGTLTSDPAFKKRLGYMPETPYFYERMTGMEFLRFCDELFEPTAGKERNYENLLRKVGIYGAKDFEIKTYSKGMRQRLGFAQSLVNDPEYLFLDEPLDGLDPIGRREMKEVMLGLKAEGRKIFLNTHILYDVEEICDQVGIIHEGKLLYGGSVKEFCAGKPLEERFMEVVETYEAHEKSLDTI